MISIIQKASCDYYKNEIYVCCPVGRKRRMQYNPFGNFQSPWGGFPTNNFAGPSQPSQFAPQNQNQNQNPQSFANPFGNFGNFGNLYQSYVPHYVDPNTNQNNPPSFSREFPMPSTFNYVRPEYVTPKVVPATTTQATIIPVTTPTPPIPTVTPPPTAEKLKLINDAACGISLGNRIIGGEDAGVGQFSWMARLAYRNKSK